MEYESSENEVFFVIGQGRNVTLSTFTALEDVQSAILVNKVVGEPPTVLRTPALALTLDKMEAASLDGAAYKDAESDVGYRLPGNSSLLRSFKGNYTDVNLQLLHMPQNPFNWDSSSTDVKDAIIGLQMSTGDQAIQVSNASEEIEFFLPQSPQKTEKNTFTVEYSNDTRIVTHFNISVAGASVLVGIETGETNLKFGLYLRYNSKPSLADFLETVHLSLEKGDNGTASGGNDGQHVWSVSPDYLQEAGTYYILVRIDGAADGQNISLDIFTVTSACLYWDGTRELWSGDGCRVGRLTALSYTHCLCNHLTVFGMSMFVMPNTVDFVKDAKLFLTFVDNPVVVSTVGAVFLVYLVLAVFARKKDEKDRALATVSILDDNDPFALYRYDVTIHTGYRRGAGTSATVTITLYGTESQSEPHVLRDKTRQVLQRGETDSFLVTTSRSMGDVEAIRLWHDNSGDYPEWFVGHVIVHDLETDQRWYFLCNSWLAVDVGQGLIDRYFRVACEDDLRKFKHLFITKTAKDLRDRHLWFSILGRPARSNFTRLQRLSCALSLLLCSMLASIMFYGVPTDPHDQKMDFGVFSFTWQQLIIGIESSIVVFPVNLLIVQIFRYTEPRPQETRVESVEDCDLSKSGISVGRYQSFESLSLEICSLTEVEEDESSPLSCLETDELTELDSVSQMLQNSIISSENRQLGVPDDTRSDETISEELKIEDKSMVLESGHTLPSAVSEDSVVNFSSLQIMSSEISQDTRETSCRCHVSSRLPWWFVYVGWLLVAATSLVSAYYVMLYGLKYGKKRSIDWLVSMFVSILDSVFVEQPITVILVAAFTAFVFKTMDEEDDGSQHIEEIPLSVDNLNSLERRHEDILQHRLHEKIYSPPEQETVDIYRQRKEITKKIYALLREIFGYLIFIWLLLVIAHGQRDKQAYYMSRNVENIFFNNKNFKIWLHEYSTFFNWTYERLLPGLHGDEPGFISDQASKLVGVARLRQIRNKKGSCSMVESASMTISQCHGEYSRSDEDTSSYLASWQPSPGNRSAIKDPASPWSYQKSVSIPYWGQAAIYSGGGYVADLATDRVKSVETINYLRDRVWLDDQTRALFVEFTLYNANANLFGMVTLLIERPGIGGLLKKYEILTMKFYRYSADFMLFVMTCEIVYILFILFFMFVEGKQMYLLGREYFKNVWNWLELLIILASWSAIAIYIMRQVIADRTLQEHSDTPDQFISFHTAAMLAQTLEYVIALLVLLGTLKLLHLLRINPRIYLLTSALKSASKELGGFFAMLAVTFTAFACTAYVLLGAGVRGFQNLLLAYESLFSLMLGYVDEETRKFNPLFSAFLVITFVILTLFFIINLFIALIIEALLNVRHNHQPSPDEKIVDQLITKLTSVFTAPKRSKN
ncbi:polycystin-1-like protein 2 [Ptychodera flava]|uniref:polycystin-1-like protein 2 n=1 Tax=Ptychodera flava TaxID=63121 RepID=UPI003969EA0A